ncbi:hypothetical protein KQX54_002729 [Cotesia glomerata]|uniref:Uncharacterized protein n=1 Tax=Cotesia glomerata TaxID=32391 RepID=A0AAV7HYH7_COTGL|nr:hypothetical protein KQX54_002729 [Cotesia glomerata]
MCLAGYIRRIICSIFSAHADKKEAAEHLLSSRDENALNRKFFTSTVFQVLFNSFFLALARIRRILSPLQNSKGYNSVKTRNAKQYSEKKDSNNSLMLKTKEKLCVVLELNLPASVKPCMVVVIAHMHEILSVARTKKTSSAIVCCSNDSDMENFNSDFI